MYRISLLAFGSDLMHSLATFYKEASVASTTVVCMTSCIRESWTGGAFTRVHQAADWLGAIWACCYCVVAAAGGKSVFGMNVAVGVTRALYTSATAAVYADVSSTTPGAGFDPFALVSDLPSSDKEASIASATEICTTCGIGEEWTGRHLTGVNQAVDWSGAVRAGCCCVIAATGCNLARKTGKAVRRAWTRYADATTTLDSEFTFASGTMNMVLAVTPACFHAD